MLGILAKLALSMLIILNVCCSASHANRRAQNADLKISGSIAISAADRGLTLNQNPELSTDDIEKIEVAFPRCQSRQTFFSHQFETEFPKPQCQDDSLPLFIVESLTLAEGTTVRLNEPRYIDGIYVALNHDASGPTLQWANTEDDTNAQGTISIATPSNPRAIAKGIELEQEAAFQVCGRFHDAGWDQSERLFVAVSLPRPAAEYQQLQPEYGSLLIDAARSIVKLAIEEEPLNELEEANQGGSLIITGQYLHSPTETTCQFSMLPTYLAYSRTEHPNMTLDAELADASGNDDPSVNCGSIVGQGFETNDRPFVDVLLAQPSSEFTWHSHEAFETTWTKAQQLRIYPTTEETERQINLSRSETTFAWSYWNQSPRQNMECRVTIKIEETEQPLVSLTYGVE